MAMFSHCEVCGTGFEQLNRRSLRATCSQECHYTLTARTRAISGYDALIDEVKRLYLEEGWSTQRIGEKIGYTSPTVLAWLRRAEVPMRPYYRGDIPESELRRLYLEEGYSVYQLAAHFKTGGQAIKSRIERHGLVRTPEQEVVAKAHISRMRAEVNRIRMGYTDLRTYEDLIDEVKKLYLEEDWIPKRIGEHIGYSTRTVVKWLKKAEVPMRSRSEVRIKMLASRTKER